MISTIIDCLSQFLSTLDTMYVFPDFPSISLLKMIIGFIIIIILLNVISGKETQDDDI